MKKITVKHILVIALMVVSSVVMWPGAASAQGNSDSRGAEGRQNAAEHKELAKNKLEDGKLRACENRQKAITNILTRIADRGQKQIFLFGTIAQRTQNFYTDKGLSVANYDDLVADVSVKKAAAQATVDSIKATSVIFDCSSDDPKGMASSFKESLKKEIEALKAFKTAVNNLIVGVKSAGSQNGGQ